MITIVMPIAMMAITAIRLATLIKFSDVKKFGHLYGCGVTTVERANSGNFVLSFWTSVQGGRAVDCVAAMASILAPCLTSFWHQ